MKQTNLMTVAAVAALLAGASQAQAEGSPVGVWIDAKGRGAVEIKECGRGMLCGHIVWVSNKREQHGCGQQLLGDVRSVGGGAWDYGWIIDPDDRRKYDVALERVSRTKLKVTGYMGSKMFSQELMWKRAPADLERCDRIEEKKETIIATRVEEPASSGPVNAPNPERNPIDDRFDVAEIQPPAPVPAVRPVRVKVAQQELSEGAQEAMDVMSIPADASRDVSIMALAGPPRRVASRQKTCKVLAPFVALSFPCNR